MKDMTCGAPHQDEEKKLVLKVKASTKISVNVIIQIQIKLQGADGNLIEGVHS